MEKCSNGTWEDNLSVKNTESIQSSKLNQNGFISHQNYAILFEIERGGILLK